MKKVLLFIFLLLLNSCNFKSKEVVNVVSSSYIVIEQSTNKILQGNNYQECRSVASISKIMTAIVVIENNDLNKIITIPKEIEKVGGSSVYLKAGEQKSVLDLLYGLIIISSTILLKGKFVNSI